jgi:hypothetical protein
MVLFTIRLIANFRKPFRTYPMRFFVDTADSAEIKFLLLWASPVA